MINGQSEKQISQPKKQAKLHFLWPNSQEPRVQLIEQWKQLICSRDVLHSKQVSMSNSTFLQLSKHNLKTKYNFWCVYFTCYGVLIQLCRTLCDPMDRSPSGSSVHRHSPGKNSGVGFHALPVQGIFPTQGSNPGLRHYRQLLYQLNHQGSPRILEGVAYPFSRESSGPRNWTGVSSIVGGFFTSRAIREDYASHMDYLFPKMEDIST